MCAGRLLTDSLVDGRVVEGLDERLLLFPRDRVHFEVTADEELTGHFVWSCAGWDECGEEEEGGRGSNDAESIATVWHDRGRTRLDIILSNLGT